MSRRVDQCKLTSTNLSCGARLEPLCNLPNWQLYAFIHPQILAIGRGKRIAITGIKQQRQFEIK